MHFSSKSEEKYIDIRNIITLSIQKLKISMNRLYPVSKPQKTFFDRLNTPYQQVLWSLLFFATKIIIYQIHKDFRSNVSFEKNRTNLFHAQWKSSVKWGQIDIHITRT